ncbi:hypothetical protein IH781_01800 [Patescibacteria group bacterium]|nr:hypothetical protein [Patescibacteria group bacterium]
MGSKQHTIAIAFTAKTIFLAAILLVGYYFGWLRPQLALPKALIEAQTQLAQHHAMLLQNRLALTELTRLDSTSANVHQEKGKLLATLERTNDEGLNALNNLPALPRIAGTPTTSLNFLNNDLGQTIPTLVEKHRSILHSQQELLTKFKNIDTALANVFRYNPELDLGRLDLRNDQEELLKRAKVAQKGLSAILDNLTGLGLQFPDVANVMQGIQNLSAVLDELTGHIESGNTQQAAEARTTFISQFAELKALALSAELALITSDASVALLTKQTNLILEYDFRLKQTRAHLSNLAR